jgi:uncharacterized protein (DUF2147 family)
MKLAITALSLVAGLVFSASAFAQETPVGKWNSIDDKTKKPRAEIRITETAGVLSAKIEKRLDADAKPDDKCDKCTDDRKDKPLQGLEIVRKVKKLDEPGVWGDGEILDPENGRIYKVKLTPKEGGKKLDVRGSFGPFGRTQTWVRVE